MVANGDVHKPEIHQTANHVQAANHVISKAPVKVSILKSIHDTASNKCNPISGEGVP